MHGQLRRPAPNLDPLTHGHPGHGPLQEEVAPLVEAEILKVDN